MTRHCCQIALASTTPDATLSSSKPHLTPLVDTPTDYTISLAGKLHTVMAARADLLQHSPFKINLDLKIPVHDCPPIPLLRQPCDEIEQQTQTTVTISNPPPKHSSFASENTITIRINGLPPQAEIARVRVLTILDSLSDLSVDTVQIPLRLQPLICGRKRIALQPIIEETLTNIYFPSPFVDPLNNTSNSSEFSPPIYITGDPGNLSRVKDMLTKLAAQKAKSMYHKDTIMHARKLDWMLLHRRDELRTIMHDNGSFIALPALGSGTGLVTVYAENRVNAERTLRSLNFLACSIYEACFYFNNRDGAIYGTDGSNTFFNSITNLANLVTQLSQISGAEVAYKTDPGCIQVHGTERAVRNVYQRLHEMTFLKMFHQDTTFSVELSNEQREFISGKKSGKINKIMKTSGAKIKFMPFSEYNFIIEVESTSFTKALDGLTLLQEELPAEISFYVPETYHKRIIGVGGKNIQRIMKKYGVYVKFSNAEEFAALGGYYGNDDNVVARTPMKNQLNLDNLRHAVMELISAKDKDFVVQTVGIPFRSHRAIIRDNEQYLKDISQKANTRILWPDHELASDSVTLIGPEAQVGNAAQMLRACVPEDYCLYVSYSPGLSAILASEHYREAVVDRLEHEMNVQVTLGTDDQDGDQVIVLKMNKANLDCLPAALDILVGYLKSQNIRVYEDPPKQGFHTKRSSSTSSVADSFGIPFGNKVLPSVTCSAELPGIQYKHQHSKSTQPQKTQPLQHQHQQPQSHIHQKSQQQPKPHSPTSSLSGFSSYSLFDYPGSTSGSNVLDASWRHFRDINSPRTAENIRAIFDTPIEQTTEQEIALAKHRRNLPMAGTGGLGYRVNGGVSSGGGSSGLTGNADIWTNPPQVSLMNPGYGHGSVSTGTTNSSMNLGLDGHKQMLYADQPAGIYQGYPSMNNSNHNGLPKFNPHHTHPAAVDFQYYICPTSSTSTGSNSSLHSSQSIPEPLTEHEMRHFKHLARRPHEHSLT
ncbi:hypothetical protein CLU79DRAFT_758842 [Phycomyces nitens]|nr:hypothetical protein CLU79DRAFT_758842 [Phycomyces nitens]